MEGGGEARDRTSRSQVRAGGWEGLEKGVEVLKTCGEGGVNCFRAAAFLRL